uniref:Sperm tail PG-rich repeat containing 2 n=1 Tax=Ornithorhynchus anatinus TaxID=9258 RepID=A0A6I8PPN2_ORNAN
MRPAYPLASSSPPHPGAMYDRAPRSFGRAERCGTEAHVGPGSYQVPCPKERGAGGYAPFLSLANRDSGFMVRHPEDVSPGPGHYDIPEAQNKVKGCMSLQNREMRFKTLTSIIPGPGSYDQSYRGTLQIMKNKLKEAPPHFQLKMATNQKLCPKVDVPSIPSPGQSFGYQINEDGTVLRQFPPPSDKTLGPAYYKPMLDGPYSTRKYRGVYFGHLTGRREAIQRGGPGPGDYDIMREGTVHYENVNIKKEEKTKGGPFLPRYYEVIALREEKKGVPGPGKYNIKSQFEKAESVTPKGSEMLHPPFLSQAKRFVPVKSITPAPGTYDEPRTALESLKKTSGLRTTPFGQTATRFPAGCGLEETPGPAYYDIFHDGNTSDGWRKSCWEKARKDAFGSSAPRIFHHIKREAFSSPGPADYQMVDLPKEHPRSEKPASAFLSKTEKKTPVATPPAPAPGSYEVQKSFEKSRGKSVFMPPRTSVARRKHASFLSGSPRYPECKPGGPGPGTYNPVVKAASNFPLFGNRGERFKEQKEITPGPGAYEELSGPRETEHSILQKPTRHTSMICQLCSPHENSSC